MNTKSETFLELLNLAKNPIDLSVSLTKERLNKYHLKGLDLDYFYATERIDDKVLSLLQKLSLENKVIEKYQAMINGEVINKIDNFESENRKVLHTSSRDVFDNKCYEEKNHALEELTKLKEFCSALDNGLIVNSSNEAFTDMILVGIGGSDLGPRAIYLALKAYSKQNRRVHFISNVDPDDSFQVLQNLDLSKTLVCVISKSGTTLETLTNEKLVAQRFIDKNLSLKDHFLCVTGKGSLMDNEKKYRKVFYMYDYIGGRYSSCSMVGAVILSYALGYEQFEQFLQGANSMDKYCNNDNIFENIVLLDALIGIWNRNFLNYESLAILPYSQAMSRFTAHLQQCDMESNGKSINKIGNIVDYHTGPVIWGEVGTNGQHAFYQLLHQGTSIIPCQFIAFKESQYNSIDVDKVTSQQKLLANVWAQSIALAKGQKSDNPNKNFTGNRPNSIIFANKLTPNIMGQILAFYEHKIAFQGFIWNINSFDQEGVQLGKVLANEIISYWQNDKQNEHLLDDIFNKLDL